MSLIFILLLANAIAHIISFIQLKKVQSSNANGVLAFAFINTTIAILMWQDVDWSKWLALIFPLIGGLALLATTILKGQGKWIDYTILILDIAIIGLVLNHYIL